MTETTTLYRFFAADGTLLYVGITGLRWTRWHQHAATKDWWAQVTAVTVEHFDSRVAAEEAEGRAIENEGPRYNVRRPARPKPLKAAPAPRARKSPSYSRPCDRSIALTCDVLDPVGEIDIARRTGVQPNTVHVWMQRGQLPEPRFFMLGVVRHGTGTSTSCAGCGTTHGANSCLRPTRRRIFLSKGLTVRVSTP